MVCALGMSAQGIFIRLRRRPRLRAETHYGGAGNPFASADVRPYLERADRYSAKLPHENVGTKQNR